MGRPNHVMTTTLPHPDHFDGSKFGPDGQPIGRAHGKIGRRSNLRPEDVAQLLFLERLRDTAAQDLIEFLIAKGFKTNHARVALLKRVHNGWRPTR